MDVGFGYTNARRQNEMMLLKLELGVCATFLFIFVVETITPLINGLGVTSLPLPFAGTTFSSHCSFSFRYHCSGSGTSNVVKGLIKCGRRRRDGGWGRWDGEGFGAPESTITRMVVYNPNDELRAIVQRKQLEVKSLLAAHTAADDRLQVNDRTKTDFNLIEVITFAYLDGSAPFRLVFAYGFGGKSMAE